MKRILFIDDEKELFPVIQKIFSKDQYRIVCAADGLEGLLKFRNEEFDLIISDYKMPKMDGVKFYTQIRELENTRKTSATPILFVSAFADEIKSRRRDWVSCDFLGKPYQVYELMKKVAKLLDPESTDTEIRLERRVFLDKGEVLFDEGDMSREMYFVVSGSLGAYKKTATGEEIQVGSVLSGELVGEMAIIDEAPRVVKLIAHEVTELITIPPEKIMSQLEAQPKWIKLMLETLSKRLRDTLKQVG